MVGKWKMTAACNKCGISLEEISPDEILITSDRFERVVCPGCGELLHVVGGGDYMDTSRMLHYNGKVDGKSVMRFIYQKKKEPNRNATGIWHEMSKIRAKLNYGSLPELE